MAIAIIKTGGKQYKVNPGLELKIEKLEGNVGDKIKFDQVLFVADDAEENVEIGLPTIQGKVVEAEILAHGRYRKIKMIQYKRKTRNRRRQGHRQNFTKVKIASV
ncbi:MAG: 50S ribosomal protein L21 [Patescibacteria group bacterium]